MAKNYKADDAATDEPVESVIETAATDEPVDNAGLVPMTKDGKVINAHPTTVAHHKGNGWKLA